MDKNRNINYNLRAHLTHFDFDRDIGSPQHFRRETWSDIQNVDSDYCDESGMQ